MRHDFADGKYTVINNSGILTALRNGEPWVRDLVGDNLVYWMLVEVDRLKEELATQKSEVKPCEPDRQITQDEWLMLDILDKLERYQVKRQDFDRFADVISSLRRGLKRDSKSQGES